ncbi:MAG: glycoside hydrolase family 2 protein [Burkholderiales bacterium]|nr:glycoside hydrolase family 2 protein [Opitutaceae bacterium]
MTTLDLSRATWRFRDTTSKTWLPARIPGCVHQDLRRANKIPDPFAGTNELDLQWIEERDWEYHASFQVPAKLLAEELVELVADGLDTVAAVWLNGEKIAETDNMFVGHRWPVGPLLHTGANELRIVFTSALRYIRTTRTEFVAPTEFNDPVGHCVRIRKQACQFGWDWGPRFVTAGVWRGLRLEAGGAHRLDHVQITQTHLDAGRRVSLAIKPSISGPARREKPVHSAVLSLAGREVARVDDFTGDTLTLEVPDPQLWWPAGQGAQPLYDLTVVTRDAAGSVLGTITKRLGLRTIVLDQSPDAEGRKFQFVINGRAVFIKGANWIPVHAFVARLGRADYERDLRAAALAHMNCVRLWGGGIYESEDFYDICDELGLLVWNDFMFACSLYPSDPAFLASVRAEADYQIKRIRHHASLALWCGNNELAWLNAKALGENPAHRQGYEALFHDVLAQSVATNDLATPYWPSSPWRGGWEHDSTHAVGEKYGDTHYWDVWHARHPVKDYEKWRFRFCSEFGMQSYSSPETNATFAPADANVFGAVMENHQKNRAGNQIILDYVSRRYRFPKSQDDLIYLSQLNQAYCMQVGVEHYRRTMPHCMGAIYWQLNDCWPVASWSSIEFTGKWKALHHAARRFNAPALVSVHVPGDETPIVGNYRRSTVREVHLHTVYDAPKPARGLLHWDLFTLDGKIVFSGEKKVTLRHGESTRQRTLDLAKPLAAHGRDQLYLRAALDIDGQTVSEQTAFLSPARFLDLPKAKTKTTIKAVSPTRFELGFTSTAFQHALAFDLAGISHTSSDNFFDLYPNETKIIVVTLDRPATKAALAKALSHRSLVNTYV